jgi:hypothetical protein
MVVPLAARQDLIDPAADPRNRALPVSAEVLLVITTEVASVGSARRHVAVVGDFEACA